MKTLFLSLLPHVVDESGHEISYQKCLETAIHLMRYRISYFGLFPKHSNLKRFQKNWIPFFHKNLFLRWMDFFRIFLIKKKKIVFIESFKTSDFLILSISFFLFSNKDDLLLVLFRYDLQQLRQNGLIHLMLSRLCRIRLGTRFIMLTDSERIAQDFKKRAHLSLTVLPIPHVDQAMVPRRGVSRIICWWPGPPRPSKGLADVLRIAMLPNRDPSTIELVAAHKSQLPNTTLIADVLERREYLFWLHASDFILLPYDPVVYRCGTSSVFVEAVIAGKIPLVKKGSWLSFECEKYDLNELIINWEEPTFFQMLAHLRNDAAMLAKLRKMQEAYSVSHSIETFTTSLQKVFERTHKTF